MRAARARFGGPFFRPYKPGPARCTLFGPLCRKLYFAFYLSARSRETGPLGPWPVILETYRADRSRRAVGRVPRSALPVPRSRAVGRVALARGPALPARVDSRSRRAVGRAPWAAHGATAWRAASRGPWALGRGVGAESRRVFMRYPSEVSTHPPKRAPQRRERRPWPDFTQTVSNPNYFGRVLHVKRSDNQLFPKGPHMRYKSPWVKIFAKSKTYGLIKSTRRRSRTGKA